MYIDLHCHTLKSEIGDSEKRNINKENFLRILRDRKVRIAAITNHNVFNKEQFYSFRDNDDIDVWPGIELDVKGHSSYGHCIIIANPNNVTEFSNTIEKITSGYTPDNFKITIEDLCLSIGELNVIVFANYGSRTIVLNKEDLDLLKSSLKKLNPFYSEVSDLKSAGIITATNRNSLIGSGVTNWDKYNELNLPFLKTFIDSYTEFLSLIKKEDEIIKYIFKSKGQRDYNYETTDKWFLDETREDVESSSIG